MNFVDILIWGILLGFVAKGFMKGLVREVCTMLGLIVGCWAAFRYYPAVAGVLRPVIHLPTGIAAVISFILIFITVGLLFYFLGHLLTVVFKIALLGGVNRIGGVVFGFLQGALLLSILLYLGSARSAPDKLKQQIQRSRSAPAFVTCGRDIIAGWEHETGGTARTR